MLSEGLVLLWSFLLAVMGREAAGCECPKATFLTRFPPEAPPESCCLNYSGSSLGRVEWGVFSDLSSLEVLDLSDCNITHVLGASASPPSLRELYLGGNELRGLPKHFLSDASSLRLLDLRGNLLERLPGDFLQGSGLIRELWLDSNRLQILPRSVFKASLEHLELSNNPWACACPLVEELQRPRLHADRGNGSSSWQDVVGNLTCASPVGLAGRSVWTVPPSEVCQSPGLTALFILLPLLLILALVLCWCCGRKRKRKEGSFRPAKWAPEVVTTQHNGSDRDRRPNRPKPCQTESPGSGRRDALLKNQLMLRPSSDLLSSSRDLYEEVEVRLGSADSLAPPASQDAPAGANPELQEGPDASEEDDRADPETVSVTEVMKDSADREKAYLTQSTEYYSLVPGLSLEDSDQGEYESVDLS
ncbi:leucine-rich repeat, immunoglobulin-like domain and transmembrane domain-containing protein 1 [Megalops cyprinoides]|uniref:leucine-rich repeat, immunoglobulin-like domain and transmembrane domain-containing protein 1 n=1 Tax=Megalops cyprinoides TaxID=118141 RepID=UPI0018653337|nr:leucine-rich repeat, immunoglobulin-like domain and transmembrane domain-containing protein 1 [Megalops cyprinoides]